jgi:superfamily I DNA/RNA helicase
MTLVLPKAWQPQGVDGLEPRAWEALREVQRSVCVTAGAGAGKTEFLAQKAAYLLETGLCPSPKRILAISFKRDAARNLAERVEKRCPEEQARRFNSFTFDAFTKNFLDRFRDAIPEPWRPPNNYRIVFPTRLDHESFLESHGFHGINVQELEAAISKTQLPFDEPALSRPRVRIVQEYWRSQYRDHEDASISFPMINRLVEWGLRENPIIRRALQITYPFVFLDEFQDTTWAQFELLKTAFEGSEAVFTAVGDDKQRIMVWAGAMRDAFTRFETDFSAQRISLLRNWRSHEDLVRIQHVIACQIDQNAELPEAQAEQTVDGYISAIWEFSTTDDESESLADWIKHEIENSHVEPHDIAILVRMHANNVENTLTQTLSKRGLRLRNVARNVGEISIQDLLSEDLTSILLPILRLGSVSRSPNEWTNALKNFHFLEGVDSNDDKNQQRLQFRLQNFIRELRRTMRNFNQDSDEVQNVAKQVLEFVGIPLIRQAFSAYQRAQDFDRVWKGFLLLLGECTQHVSSWAELLDEFEGVGQISLMTIHKSKGLEFHTMIFYGLDNQTWWRLTPNRAEELITFFVAFTRAKQRAFFTLCIERGGAVTWIENLLAPAGVLRIKGCGRL